MPVLLGRVGQLVAPDGHPGVVVGEVEAPEGLHGGGHHGLDLGRVAHVGVHVEGLATGCLDAGDGLGTGLVVDVDHHHPGALAGEDLG